MNQEQGYPCQCCCLSGSGERIQACQSTVLGVGVGMDLGRASLSRRETATLSTSITEKGELSSPSAYGITLA